MRGITLDLLLVLLMAIGLTFLYDYAMGRATEELATVVALVDSIVLSLYVVLAVIPRYIAKIRDSDLRDWLNTVKFGILLVPIMIISTGGDVFNTKPNQTTAIICVMVAVMVYSTIKLVYIKYMIKRNAKLLNKSKGGSE